MDLFALILEDIFSRIFHQIEDENRNGESCSRIGWTWIDVTIAFLFEFRRAIYGNDN